MEEFSITALRVVREVALRGSFSDAAERLDYTQSAVSRQVALAERAAGRSLFERHARGVRVTDAGRLVVRHAEAVLAELEAARQGLQDLSPRPPGRLRVGAFSTATAALVPQAIRTFAAREPNTEIVLHEGPTARLLDRVASRRLDLTLITPRNQTPDGVTVVPLLDDPLLLAVHRGHALAGEPSVTPARLQRERWIAGSIDPRSELLGAWLSAAWTPEIAYVAKDWTAKLGLVAAGLGVTIVPGLATPGLPSDVAVVRIDDPAATRAIAVAVAGRTADDRRCRGFIESLRDSTAELGAELRRLIRA